MSKTYRRQRKNGRAKGKHPKHFRDRNYHHFFLARHFNGTNERYNLLLINIERHKAWHQLFGLMGAEQALALLQRVVRAKLKQAA